MGIDVHSLHLLRYARSRFGDLGRTVTLGRMAVHLGPRARQRLTQATPDIPVVYGEGVLMEKFGAHSVDSIDHSAYEGATIVADMNRPLPPTVGPYDTVIDFGCLEHIFDVRQALRNVTALCGIGGKILHILPANGYCGHGFYQYSPELFFNYYAKANGFADTEVFVATLLDSNNWYRVSPPSSGARVNIRSSTETIVLVVTRRVAIVEDVQPQQSDYVHEWTQQSDRAPPPKTRMAQWRAMTFEWMLSHRLTARIAHELDSALSPKAAKRIGAGNRALTRIDTRSF